MPYPSPLAKSEDDREVYSVYADAYSLGPYLSAADVALRTESGNLVLDLRRTAIVASYRRSSTTASRGITYPSDRILGPGWHTNLSSRITIAEEACLGVTIASVVDEVGTSYRYIDTGLTGEENVFPPDTFYSINNQAERASLHRANPDTLVLTKTFGTRLTYERLGTFFAPGGGGSEVYYRLVSVEDRNGNRIVRDYLSDDPLTRESFHVGLMYEEAHPERAIAFGYTLGTGCNGDDWGDRLVSVIDPLGRQTLYEYGPSGGFSEQFLTAITREPVVDGETGGMASPRTEFTYYAALLAAEEAIDPQNPPSSDPDTMNLFVGLASVTDPRGHLTTLAYEEEYFPSSISQGAAPNLYLPRIRLTSLTTDDGTVLFERVGQPTHESVGTQVTDTRGNFATYSFAGAVQPAANQIGKALYITELERTTAIGTVSYEWSADPFSNLLHVEDLSGNTVAYEYGTPEAKRSDQPTREILTDTGAGWSIATTYDYGVFNKLVASTDGEGEDTSYTMDAAGNRTQVHEELGKTTEYSYASDGFVTSVTDGDGRRTEYTRSFNPSNLQRHYTVTETVRGYGGELSLSTTRTYDALGNLVELKGPEGNTYGYDYDALYRVVERTEPLSGAAQTTYTLNGDPVSDTDFMGNVTVRTYDSMNRLEEERRRMNSPGANSPNDIVSNFTYGPAGEMLSMTDPEGAVTAHEYDEALRLTATTLDQVGFAYRDTYQYGTNSGSGAFSYTDGYQPTRVTNARGFHTDTVYDGFYRPVRVLRRALQTTGSGSSQQLGDHVTELVYNAAHNEIRRTVLGETAAGGDQITYIFYDDLHRAVGSALDLDGDGGPYGGGSGIIGSSAGFLGDADDQVTVFHLDLNGNRTGALDPELNLTETLFDGANRPVLIRQPTVPAGIPETTLLYDLNGNVIKQTDPNGNETEIFYDERNREVLRILDLNGDGTFDATLGGDDIVTAHGYDAMDNVLAKTDSNGNTRTFIYDRAYREVERVEPAVPDPENNDQLTNPRWTTEYDRSSNPTRRVDPRGVVTALGYDALNRLVRETAAFGTPDALTTTYQHDASGNVTASTLDNGAFGLQRTEFAFDPFDRLETETWPGGRVTTSEYYRNGLLERRVDPKGQEVQHEYDAAARETKVTFLRSDLTLEEERLFTYDRANNLVHASYLYGESSCAYDALYRKTSEGSEYIDPSTGAVSGYTITHAYDLNGNQVLTTYPNSARVVTREFDGADRLTRVIDNRGTPAPADDLATSYAHDPNGNVLSVAAPNGVTTTGVYDALDRKISLLARTPSTIVYQAGYVFDLAGNRREIDENVHGQAPRALVYGYDAQYRLTLARVGLSDTTYAYDPAGNRLTMQKPSGTTTYAYNERNELEQALSAAGTRTLQYDLNGNLAQLAGAGPTRHYYWDTSNRLVSSTLDGAPVFAAAHDHRGRRFGTRVEGTDTLFIYTEGLTLQEVSVPSNEILVDYVHGIDMGGGVGAILYGVRPLTALPSGAQSLGAPSGSQGRLPALAKASYEFCTSSHVGHTVALTNLQGKVRRTELFDAFGATVSTTGSTKNTRRAYTKERDASLGLDNHGFRYYCTETGRYISRDPIGYADGLNVYLHTGNNPVNRFDPKGLFSEEPELREARKLSIRDSIITAAVNWWHGEGVAAPVDPLHGSMFSEEAIRDYQRQQALFVSGALDAPDLSVDLALGGGVALGMKSGGAALGRFATRHVRGHLLRNTGEGTADGALKAAGDVPSPFLLTNAPGDVAARSARIPWRSWDGYDKVIAGGREYAKVGDRLYTRHAVERMQPSGLRFHDGGFSSGRSIAPNFIEDVIQTGTPRSVTVSGVERTIHTSASVEVVTEQGGRIVVSVNPFSGGG